MAAMLHARNNTILFLWDKMFILMQNIFIVPGMQHGRHAKPLFAFLRRLKRPFTESISTVDLKHIILCQQIFTDCEHTGWSAYDSILDQNLPQ